MNWKQVIDPFNNIALSALAAAIPILFIFWALIIRKMKGYLACLFTSILAIVVSIIAYGMPTGLALLSTADGALYGLFNICWIIIGAMFLYNVTVRSGQFDILRNFMSSITTDRRLQALLIAFSFGSFLEGAAGFGAPVAITAAMLVGLGFNPLYAAGLCLIANTAPVAFGSIGIPITVAAQISGLPEMAVSQMVGRTLPFLSILVPFYLVFLMSGYKRTKEVLPAILVSGISFAVSQFITSNYVNPMLPDVISGLFSIICLMTLLKYWKPKTVWHFKDEPAPTIDTNLKYARGQIIKAWLPFIIMTVLVMAWGLQPIKDALNSVGQIKFYLPGLHDHILAPDDKPLTIKPATFNYLSNPGTAILLAALITLPLIGMSLSQAGKTFLFTLKQLKWSMVTIASVLGFAFIVNNSGMSTTMALALAGTGSLFPFFSPILGWLGVFLTGSDTSSNALFCKLQYTSAQTIGVDPVITVAANASGGVTAKMISPQSIAVGTAAVGLVGKESALFRFTVKHSFIMLFVVCCFTVLQAYVFKWMVPVYQVTEGPVAATEAHLSTGFLYLLIVAGLIVLIVLAALWSMRNSKIKNVVIENSL
jgi:lactate permease